MKNEITAKRLAIALSNIGIRPQELADRSGVSKSSISQYMNGSHAPSNISSGKMAPVLNVNPLWLMGFDVPMELQNDASAAPSPAAALPSPASPLTDLDMEVANKFHDADSISKAMVMKALDIELEDKKEKGIA